MKRTRTLALLTALVCLCVSLTACSPKEVLKSAILKTTTALGLRQETSDEDEVDDLSYATGGGDVTFPETMDTTASKLVSEVDGDTLYVAFNGIQNRSTDYFVAGSDSLSITGYATTESTRQARPRRQDAVLCYRHFADLWGHRGCAGAVYRPQCRGSVYQRRGCGRGGRLVPARVYLGLLLCGYPLQLQRVFLRLRPQRAFVPA